MVKRSLVLSKCSVPPEDGEIKKDDKTRTLKKIKVSFDW